MAADDASGVDNALVRGAYEAADERKVLRGRQATRQRRGRFQVGHQNRRGAAIGMRYGLHPFEMREICGRGRCEKVGHSELAPERLRGYEERTLAIGFADLTGSTAMAGALSFDELGDAISEFEDIAADAVGRGRGRLVKPIGDEVMFAAADPVAACHIGLDITSRLRDRPMLPLARVGICFGGVLVRHGDCFGPVVNRASRLVDLADPGTVIADEATQRAVEADPERAVGLSFEPQGDHALRGLDNKVTIARVLG